MATTRQSAISEFHPGRAFAPDAARETLGPLQARITTAIIAMLIPALPLFMGGRTPFAPSYLADALLVTGMAVVLIVVFWPARTRAPASREARLWIAFAAVVSGYIILQALPVPALARLLGPYPEAIWQLGEVHPRTWSPNASATLHGAAVVLALWTAAYTMRHLPSRYIGYILLAIGGSALFQAASGLLAHASGANTILGLWPRVSPD